MSVRLLIAGGGTSGHINPAISIADRIRTDAPGSEIEFCGTQNGMESHLIPEAGYRMHVIRASGFPSVPSLKLIRALSDFKAGREACLQLISTFRPDAVVGTGGYVCSPLISAAAKKNIPIILHEQNAYPGRSNRFLSRKAAAVLTGFPDMEHYFPYAKEVCFTGNPIRSVFRNTNKIASRKALGFRSDEFVILAMGGSLGSRTINRAIVDLSKKLNRPNIRIILSAGKQQYAELKEEINGRDIPVEIYEYIDETHTYLSAADLVICRAGAITCAEIASIGLPSIMVPYPFAAGDHQTYNARAFEEAKAGLMISDSNLSADRLAEEIGKLLDCPHWTGEMAKNARGLHISDSDEKISEIIRRICNKDENSSREA